MYYLVTNSRVTDPDEYNLAIVETTPIGLFHHDWTDSLLDSLNDPYPQSCDVSLEQLLSGPGYCADTILLSFSNLDELALTHPEYLL